VLCLSTRYCLLEMIYFALQGQWSKTLRRCSGTTIACVAGQSFVVQYPTVSQLRRFFAPHFKLRELRGIGVAIPPSYLEAWAVRHPHLLRTLCAVERFLSPLPFFRVTGDHVLLCFERVQV